MIWWMLGLAAAATLGFLVGSTFGEARGYAEATRRLGKAFNAIKKQERRNVGS